MSKQRKVEPTFCPFCGGDISVSRGQWTWDFTCHNEDCRAHISFATDGDEDFDEQEAIKRFNRRSDEYDVYVRQIKDSLKQVENLFDKDL